MIDSFLVKTCKANIAQRRRKFWVYKDPERSCGKALIAKDLQIRLQGRYK